MKYRDCMIGWNPHSDQICVGLAGSRGNGWSRHPIRYERTAGGCCREVQDCKGKRLLELSVFLEFHAIVVRDKVPVAAAHEAFLAIDEYRERIAPDIAGADHHGDVFSGLKPETR